MISFDNLLCTFNSPDQPTRQHVLKTINLHIYLFFFVQDENKGTLMQ